MRSILARVGASDTSRTMDVVLHTDLPLPLVAQGKVRDIYALGDDLLMVASDRLSAFDVVFSEGIPRKGRILTTISSYWARELEACHPYHLITDDVDQMDLPFGSQKEMLRGRAQRVERLDMLPVECVVRGYLTGSAWKDYQGTGSVCGHELPGGLEKGDRLPAPIFTPATKAASGDHDENISFDRMVEMLGEEASTELRHRTLSIYTEGSRVAAERGLVLVDTKLEFGKRPDGTLVLADEILTPDSSRYWDERDVARTPKGETPPSFDKQVVRDYLETLDWDKKPPAPTLPPAIIHRASARYEELLARVTLKRKPES